MKMRPTAAAGEILAKPGLTDMKKFFVLAGMADGVPLLCSRDSILRHRYSLAYRLQGELTACN